MPLLPFPHQQNTGNAVHFFFFFVTKNALKAEAKDTGSPTALLENAAHLQRKTVNVAADIVGSDL